MAYSNILLNDALKNNELSVFDKKFASALFYGVLERKITLDEIIKMYSSKDISSLNCEVIQILRMGIYQLVYMDSVPDNAAVDESVKLCKEYHFKAAAGFVNAVLRSFIRNDKSFPVYNDEIKDLSIWYSCPEWLCRKWINEYGSDIAESMLKSSIGRAPITLKVNTLKCSCDELINQLAAENIKCIKSDVIENCVEVFSSGSLEETAAYKNGMFFVQDISCQLCCESFNAKPGDVIIDFCAAPGGKSFTTALSMNNDGKLISCDLHEKRVKLIADGAKRLGISNIDAITNNAKVFNNSLPMADKILCDVPCSGLGVIRRKPEIKYKDPNEFSALPEIQYDILQTSSEYLKVGGELIYSTCTLSRQENEDVILKFLENNPQFIAINVSETRGSAFRKSMVSVTPDMYNSDGFFIAKLRKVR